MQLCWVLREQNQEQSVNVDEWSVQQAWIYSRSRHYEDSALTADPVRNIVQVYSYERYTQKRKATGSGDGEVFRWKLPPLSQFWKTGLRRISTLGNQYGEEVCTMKQSIIRDQIHLPGFQYPSRTIVGEVTGVDQMKPIQARGNGRYWLLITAENVPLYLLGFVAFCCPCSIIKLDNPKTNHLITVF